MEVGCIGNTQIIHMEETGITQQTIGPRWSSGLRRHCLAEQFLQVVVAVQTLSLTKFIIYYYSEAM